jgi:DNA-binding NarL/FixJ family response regulator
VGGEPRPAMALRLREHLRRAEARSETIRKQLGIPARHATGEWPSRVPRASVMLGLRNAEMATELHITRRTVTTHLANIFRKLGIHERRELLGLALRTAII